MIVCEINAGSLLDSTCEALVNPVNCVGVMGAGLAWQFALRFPEMEAQYQVDCRAGRVRPGKIRAYKAGSKWILNLPTKRHWTKPSRLEDVAGGLAQLPAELDRLRITTVAIPALGCGLGGLHWSVVRPLILRAFQNTRHRVDLYAPQGERP